MGHSSSKLPSQINLVEASQAEYDFLRLVDKTFALSTEKTLRYAVYRYETYWLPLAAKSADVMPAPLDVEWVWHCHILNPRAYVHDCKTIVGTVVDHKPWFLLQGYDSKAYWNQQYPNVPFDVDFGVEPPTLEEKQRSSYDIVAACMRQKSFNYNSSLPHFRDKRFLKTAVKRYTTMLKIKKDNPDVFIVPCYDNDLVWHAHQQHVLAYRTDTVKVIGIVLDHDDSTSDRTPGSELDQSSTETKRLWKRYGKKFGVPGAMYRGEAPPAIRKVTNRFTSLANVVSGQVINYAFQTSVLTCNWLDGVHLKDALHHLPLMAPNALHKESTPCKYNDQLLTSATGMNAFTWRVVHCRQPALSAIEILDLYGSVVATAHTIGGYSLPKTHQVSNPLNVYTHNPQLERSFLIRGVEGDWAILKASWNGFVKGGQSKRGIAGGLKLSLYMLDGKHSQFVAISTLGQSPTQFKWSTTQGQSIVDLQLGTITFDGCVVDVPEYVCVGCTIAVAFVLCQPRPPPPKEGNYPPPPEDRPGILNIDSMSMLLAGGLYAGMLPRWYHSQIHGYYFYQIPPGVAYNDGHEHDLDYDFDSMTTGASDVGSTFDSGMSCDFETDGGFDAGGDWGTDSGACGGCGAGGDSGGCGSSCGGGDSGGGGGCGSSCGGGDSGGGGGCGSSCGGGCGS